MLTGIQTFPKGASPSGSLEWNFRLTDQMPSMSQLPENSKPLQTRNLETTALPSYPESDYHWLASVLDELIKFVRRSGNHSVPELGRKRL